MIIKTNDTSISNENRKSAPKHKRNKNEFRNDKTVTAIVGQLSDKDERVVVNISLDQLQKI